MPARFKSFVNEVKTSITEGLRQAMTDPAPRKEADKKRQEKDNFDLYTKRQKRVAALKGDASSRKLSPGQEKNYRQTAQGPGLQGPLKDFRMKKENVDPDKYLSQGSRKTVKFNKRIRDLSPDDQKAARKSADRKTARDKSKAPKGSRAAHNVVADAGRRYRVGKRPVHPTDPKHKQLRINQSIMRSMDDARARQRGNRSVTDDVDHSFVNAASVFLESTPAYRKMMKNYAGSDMKKVFDILKPKGFRVGEQDDTLVRNMLKKHKNNVKKVAAEIEKRYSNRFESVELGEMTLKPKVSKKYPDRTSDGFEGPYTSGQRAGRMFYYDTKADRFYDADSTEFKKRLKESVELDEMSAKQHYAKFKRGGRGKGFVVSSPIDRDRYPNRERQGLEGPYKSRKSGKIFYYDKKAGKYYDPDSDMYLQVSDVMEANEKIKVKLDPKKKIGYTIHNVGPGGKKTLVKSRDMPGKKDVG